MPKSPNKAHSIPHQWVMKRCKNPNKNRCVVCSTSLGFLSPYDKCKSCKICVHSECKPRVNEKSCGLTPKHFKELLTQMVISARQDNWAPNIGTSRSMNDMPIMHIMDLPIPTVVDSSSSTNSSAPSTPACFIPPSSSTTTTASAVYIPNVHIIPPPVEKHHPPHTASICTASSNDTFTFPETPNTNIPHIVLPISSMLDNCETSQESGGTLRLIASEDGSENNDKFGESQSTENWDQNGFNPSERGSGHKWDRLSWNMFTIKGHAGISWKEVTIPFCEIKVNSLIGHGRFGEVHEVDHFGTVAIKLLNMNHVEEEKRLEAFKQDTACFQNARHENLVFFCGYTMDRDRLGIVMELIKGQPLYSFLHNDSDVSKKLEFNTVLDFAKQICQGMSYLHTKRILHKDLRSKNVFVKDRKAVITDYGLFNVKRLAYPIRSYSFLVPNYWLCYIAPEIVRALNVNLDPLPFSERSDVYAFGTIWYELLTNAFPFSSLPSDSIFWQVGSGIKSPLTDVNSCREAKILLMHCWSFNAIERSSFIDVLDLLENMPKKPLRRSLSFPARKSFESIF